jgi:hypothetical protein
MTNVRPDADCCHDTAAEPAILLGQNQNVMKTFTYTALILGLFATSMGYAGAATPDNRHHEGFYFSFGLGPAFGHIDDKFKETGGVTEKYEYLGTPVAVDLRVGGAIKRDLVLTFDMVGRVLSSPQVRTEGGTYSTNDDVTISENTYGLGVSKFFMPLNAYVGATVGAGNFTMDIANAADGGGTVSVSSDYGFSWMLRAGKSWYLGKKWGLGFGLAYGMTNTHTEDNTGVEDMKSGEVMGTITVSYQ